MYFYLAPLEAHHLITDSFTHSLVPDLQKNQTRNINPNNILKDFTIIDVQNYRQVA